MYVAKTVTGIMNPILFNKYRFVKFIFLLTLLSAYAEKNDLQNKAFLLELIVYQQPETKSFGNIQPSKYLKFIEPKSQSASPLPNDFVFESNQSSPLFKEIAEQLTRKSVPYTVKSYMIKLDKQQSITLPLDLNIGTPADPEKPSDDHILLQGTLSVSNRLYLDITSQLSLSQYRGNHVALFDYAEHTRHLKLDKIQYLDSELVGIILRASYTNFDATRLVESANNAKPTEEKPQEQYQATREKPTRNTPHELDELAPQSTAAIV